MTQNQSTLNEVLKMLFDKVEREGHLEPVFNAMDKVFESDMTRIAVLSVVLDLAETKSPTIISIRIAYDLIVTLAASAPHPAMNVWMKKKIQEALDKI